MTIHPTRPASSSTATSLSGDNAVTPGDVLPQPADLDPSDGLSEAYRFLCAAEDKESAIDENGVTVEGTVRKNDLAEEQRDLTAEEKGQEGGHGFLGAIEKFVGDVVRDVTHLDAKALEHNVETDLDDEMWKNPHFWGDLASVAKDVGEVAGVVAGAALTAGTGGAGGVVLAVAVALSVSAMADEHLHILHALGVSDKVAGFIDGGATVAAATMTAGVTILGSATAAAATGAQRLASQVGVAATVLQGVTAGASGAGTIRQGQLDAQAEDALADETQDQQDIDRIDRVTAWFIAALKESKEGYDKAKNTVSGCIQTRDASSVALSSFSKA